ncbi:hypothetical protein PENTCL1PPCAC_29681, partial [Pristionchus entomophagus]
MEGENSTGDDKVIHIRAIAARDIAKQDVIFKGACNPYIRVRLLNLVGNIDREHVLPTRKKTRNPEWRSLGWKWEVNGDELLELTVFDERKVVGLKRRHRELGSVTVNVEEVLSSRLRGDVHLPLDTMSASSIIVSFAASNDNETMEGCERTLPEGWEARTDTNGRVFYVDHVTKSTQWERPNEESRREGGDETARRQYYEERAREV